jgi:hypothetical protein
MLAEKDRQLAEKQQIIQDLNAEANAITTAIAQPSVADLLDKTDLFAELVNASVDFKDVVEMVYGETADTTGFTVAGVFEDLKILPGNTEFLQDCCLNEEVANGLIALNDGDPVEGLSLQDLCEYASEKADNESHCALENIATCEDCGDKIMNESTDATNLWDRVVAGDCKDYSLNSLFAMANSRLDDLESRLAAYGDEEFTEEAGDEEVVLAVPMQLAALQLLEAALRENLPVVMKDVPTNSWAEIISIAHDCVVLYSEKASQPVVKITGGFMADRPPVRGDGACLGNATVDLQDALRLYYPNTYKEVTRVGSKTNMERLIAGILKEAAAVKDLMGLDNQV